jgi:L-alanine-DL-glutamate epimerase-like enolase superfamily enzyme
VSDATYERLSGLPIEIEGYELSPLELEVSTEFTRLTTVIRIKGAGQDGIGEDVTYGALDHVALQDAGPVHDLTAPSTLGELCELMGELDLFPSAPVRDVSRGYRRWAFESAALDLALRQAETTLAQALGLDSRPVTFVTSTRLGDPSSAEPLHRLMEAVPGLRFKLDPTNDWDERLIEELAATRAVDVVDLKGFYRGTPVDVETDPELYRQVAEAFPEVWIEDPDLNDETGPVLEPHRERITWDAPLHSVADIEGLPFPPRMINVKPSRFGGLRELLDVYDFCEARGIGAYGGGQFELGPGRGQIEYLASLFHPDTSNDVAPVVYHHPAAEAELPSSPLEPAPSQAGFRWGED